MRNTSATTHRSGRNPHFSRYPLVAEFISCPPGKETIGEPRGAMDRGRPRCQYANQKYRNSALLSFALRPPETRSYDVELPLNRWYMMYYRPTRALSHGLSVTSATSPLEPGSPVRLPVTEAAG